MALPTNSIKVGPKWPCLRIPLRLVEMALPTNSIKVGEMALPTNSIKFGPKKLACPRIALRFKYTCEREV